MSKYNAKKVIVTEDGTLFEEWIVKRYELDVIGTLLIAKQRESIAKNSFVSASMEKSKTSSATLYLYYRRNQK
ncbi:hypothetical protein [Paenibacillus polymyxa]|uniref:hypothetical protein n=1 Tax=Paenibacillus polymyxa TaxID=1406 RepID=UPI0021A5452D|nr:hypothetical protein [Paenibacillus polymyxa]MEE4581570.1 hypothetical protein [Paenibacillus polymyxa]